MNRQSAPPSHRRDRDRRSSRPSWFSCLPSYPTSTSTSQKLTAVTIWTLPRSVQNCTRESDFHQAELIQGKKQERLCGELNAHFLISFNRSKKLRTLALASSSRGLGSGL